MIKSSNSVERRSSTSALPGRWRREKLRAVIAESQPGFATGRREAGGIIQLRMNNVDTRGGFVWDQSLRVPGDATTIARYGLKPGDILFNNTNSVALVGKSALFRGYAEPIVYSNHFTRLRVRPDVVDAGFVALWLMSEWQARTFERICDRWIGQSAVSRDKLLDLEIPLPGLVEQKAIAARLEKQLSAVAGARRAMEEQWIGAHQLPQSYLRKSFRNITPLSAGDSKQNAPEGWSWRKLTSIARLESGHTPSRNHPEWWGGAILWIALPDIRALDGKVAFETLEYTNEQGIANSSARILPVGTVVLSRTASVGFVTMMGREMATSQDFANWVCGPEIDPFFLMYLFLASRAYFRSISSGAVHKTVYMQTSKVLQACVPPISDQSEIVDDLTAQLAVTEAAKSGLEYQLAEIDRLPASLLREAFARRVSPWGN